ncbi:hypothetical protein QCA50_019310 [Cerrena zonata]|uniref:Uncharacterized protein n=1 Tax=Cerrena zonata TaxID=2478898 RepID=A0AAW0FAZ6_9APHY
MIGSDDSLMLATPSKYFVAPQHSDDDTWIGQVTPHRLISPSIRRLRDEYDFSDPPSDDSIASVSPTSERQARRSGGSAILSSAAKARLEMYNTPRQPFASLPIVEDL